MSELHLSTKVVSVSPDTKKPGYLTVVTENDSTGQREEISVSHVFSTLPAFQLAPAVESFSPQLASALQEIKFVPMGMIHVGFNQPLLASDGFGYLVPSTEGERIVGVVYDSNAFPTQNVKGDPSSQTRLSVMSGGAHFPQVADMPLDQVEALALDALNRHLDIKQRPAYVRSMVLKNCIPQYHVGFRKTLDRIEQQLPPNLSIGGNSFYGVGLADCVTRSKQLALDFGQTLGL